MQATDTLGVLSLSIADIVDMYIFCTHQLFALSVKLN